MYWSVTSDIILNSKITNSPEFVFVFILNLDNYPVWSFTPIGSHTQIFCKVAHIPTCVVVIFGIKDCHYPFLTSPHFELKSFNNHLVKFSVVYSDRLKQVYLNKTWRNTRRVLDFGFGLFSGIKRDNNGNYRYCLFLFQKTGKDMSTRRDFCFFAPEKQVEIVCFRSGPPTISNCGFQIVRTVSLKREGMPL